MQRLSSDLTTALETARLARHDTARAMPGEFYLSERLLGVEKSELFGREWICVGRADEIPEPGDYLTYDILDEPVVAIRGEDGAIRALSNVCRHRAMPILSGKGRARRMVCPYHAWTYDSSGQLIGAPQMPTRADFDKRGCRLPEFRCETWQGFVFVTLDPETPALAPRLAALDAADRQLSLRGDEDPLCHPGGLGDELEGAGRELHGGLPPLAAAQGDAAPGEPDKPLRALRARARRISATLSASRRRCSARRRDIPS